MNSANLFESSFKAHLTLMRFRMLPCNVSYSELAWTPCSSVICDFPSQLWHSNKKPEGRTELYTTEADLELLLYLTYVYSKVRFRKPHHLEDGISAQWFKTFQNSLILQQYEQSELRFFQHQYLNFGASSKFQIKICISFWA